MGWYQTVDPETGEISEKSYRLAKVMEMDRYFENLIQNDAFKKAIESKYKLSVPKMRQPGTDDDDEEDIEDDNNLDNE
jgi:hypothetical protein